jgi:hypothetical protein
MDLPTIEVTEEEAQAKLAEYEKMLAQDRTAEDEAIAQAYRAAKRGLQVIRLTEVFKMGGWFDKDGLPRIGIAGATWPECHVVWTGDDLVFTDDGAWSHNRGALVGRGSVRVPMRDVGIPPVRSWRRGTAPIPLVPPRCRPRPRRLKHCHVLWEVEAWNSVPARDPALLRHIRGDLWAVLAVWDLTELERAVLAQR